MEIYQLLSNLTRHYDSFVFWIVLIVLLTLLIYLTRKIINVAYQLTVKRTTFELTPPAHHESSQTATRQLFVALHGLGYSRTITEVFLGLKTTYSLEIISTKEEGVRFIATVPTSKSNSFKYAVHAHLGSVKIKKTEKTLPSRSFRKILTFNQEKHFAYPLKTSSDISEHDPIAYITNAITNLQNNDYASVQLCIQPIESRSANTLSRKILNNEDLLMKLDGKKNTSLPVFSVINKILFSVIDGVSSIYATNSNRNEYLASRNDIEYQKQVAKRLKPARTLSYFEHELIKSVHRKLEDPLYRTSIRTYVTSDIKATTKDRIRSLKSGFKQYSVPKYQSLSFGRVAYVFQLFSYLSFKNGIVSPRSSILSAMELASMYHFPHKLSGDTDNLSTSLSKSLPAPASLKGSETLDTIIGVNIHHGVETPIGLTEEERERHMYIIGGTGNGKTTMMMYSIVNDIRNGKGVAVLDPHGDLAETLLGYIPKERIQDVVYINPDDLTNPIGLNLLELTPGLEGDDLLREKDLVTESVISVLRKIFSEDDSGGHRIEYVLRNTIQTALTLEGSTLFTIFRLLNDAKYRKKVVKTLADDDLKIFWQNELGKAGDFQKVKMAAGITAKIGRFLFSASAKRILEQERSTINFEEILDSQKILICNFSKGLLGEDTSTLFGTTVLAKLQVAALRRARQKQLNRKAYHLYVDEFQNFATMSFVQMLSEARKYKLFLTMAEQSTQQQEQQKLVDIILANVGTVVCFRSGSPADERLILPLFHPFIEQGEIANLPAYNFYMRIAAKEPKEPLSGMTVLLDMEHDINIANKVIESSRVKYSNKSSVVAHVEQSLKEEHLAPLPAKKYLTVED